VTRQFANVFGPEMEDVVAATALIFRTLRRIAPAELKDVIEASQARGLQTCAEADTEEAMRELVAVAAMRWPQGSRKRRPVDERWS
jgi:hypothetical protein